MCNENSGPFLIVLPGGDPSFGVWALTVDVMIFRYGTFSHAILVVVTLTSGGRFRRCFLDGVLGAGDKFVSLVEFALASAGFVQRLTLEWYHLILVWFFSSFYRTCQTV